MQFWLKAIYLHNNWINQKEEKRISLNKKISKECSDIEKWKQFCSDVDVIKVDHWYAESSFLCFVREKHFEKEADEAEAKNNICKVKTDDINDRMPNETYLNK